MTDKPYKAEKIFGCSWNDPKARMSGSQYGGMAFQLSPTEGLNPAPKADGHKVPGTRNLKNEN